MSTKISQLTSATDITASDLMQIVDVEDGVMAPSGTNKKITAQLLADDLAGIVSDGSIATSKLASGALPSGVTVSSTNLVNGTIVDADVSASAAIAGSKVSPSFTAPSVISVNSSSDALRITQTGSGNALVVEDSTNLDSTPFVIDANGRVVVGDVMSRTGPYGFPRGLQITNVGAQLTAAGNNQFGEGLTFVKSRGTPSSPHTIVQNGDSLGSVAFTGSDGSDYVLGSQISSFVDGTPGSDDMPSRLTFSTSADGTTGIVERMRITSAGNVGIGTATPVSKLHLTSSDPGFLSGLTLENTAASRKFVLSTRSDLSNPRFSISDETALAERVSILGSNGNLGIGTLTPSSRLHIAGDLTVSSATVATSATAGTNGDVPAQVAGYLVVNINGTARKIPYYA
jgi:hypothetical protein